MLRLQQLNDWLNAVLKGATFSLAPASADASFRRYFRITLDDHTLIAMDAPPPQESCAPFAHAAEVFAQAGLNVPRILEQDLERGFLLLGDLGDTTFLNALNQRASSNDGLGGKFAGDLYRDACMALVKLQSASKKGVFPAYDEALLTREMQLFPDWYVAKHLVVELDPAQKNVLSDTFAMLNQNILAQGQVYVHRDYHSRNLMVCTDAQGSNPGILDFQDAVFGAITYDLVSLLKDAYIYWDEEQVIDWAVRYWQAAKEANLPVPQDFSEFYRDFEWTGAQRHLKILGIFARLYYRDGKDGYLKDIPLVMDYLRRTCDRYVELRPLLRLLNQLAGMQTQVGHSF